MKTSEVVLYGGLAVAAYLLYKKFAGVVDSGANAIAKPISDLWVQMTSPTAPVPLGNIIMPDSSYFPASNLTGMNTRWQGNVLYFDSGGVTYSLSPQVGGNYQATRV